MQSGQVKAITVAYHWLFDAVAAEGGLAVEQVFRPGRAVSPLRRAAPQVRPSGTDFKIVIPAAAACNGDNFQILYALADVGCCSRRAPRSTLPR